MKYALSLILMATPSFLLAEPAGDFSVEAANKAAADAIKANKYSGCYALPKKESEACVLKIKQVDKQAVSKK